MNIFVSQKEIYIHGPCAYLPERVVDNAEIIALTKSAYTKEMIGFSTGIRQRHWANEQQACSDLAVESCRKLFAFYPDLKATIGQVILATISGDFVSPPTSPHVMHRLGIQDAGAMDLGAACAGFVTGLHTAAALVHSTEQTVLLIASEIRSKFLNLENFGTSVLFGDGAGSAFIGVEKNQATFKLLASATYADGEVYDTVSIPAGGSRNPIAQHTPLQSSKITITNNTGLFVKAVHGMTLIAEKLMGRLNLKSSDIAWLVPHQGNRHLVFSVAKQLQFKPEQTMQTVMTSGNTSGASCAIALAELRDKALEKGQLVLVTASGGGGFAAAAVLEVV